jgi:ADP-L-glycero-D-manno-heptose 6-epimerase
MKILVTGHNGFIGQNMVGYLRLQGHDVDGWEYVPNTCPPVDRYDWVVHLGAISSTTERDVEKVLEQNLEFSARLVSLCDTVGTNFQYASSASVYGNNLVFRESAPAFPQSPYAWSKYLFDRFVLQDKFDIIVQGFRYFNVYGPFEDHKGAQASPVTKFTKQARETGEIQVFQNSEQLMRDFVCVEDVCRVHDMMFNVKESGIFNVGTGSPRSFREVAEAIATRENAKIVEVPMPPELISQYQTYTCADLIKLNQHIHLDWIDIIDWINR